MVAEDVLNFREGLRGQAGVGQMQGAHTHTQGQQLENPQNDRHTKHKILNRHLTRQVRDEGWNQTRFSSQIQPKKS
jgi:hypothetical protein